MASQSQSTGGATTEVVELENFNQLLEKAFKPRDAQPSDQVTDRVKQAVQTLAQLAVKETRIIGGDVFATLDKFIAEIDEKLTTQINEILHNPEFQKVESAWRGLRYLLDNTSTGANSRIKVMNITKNEVAAMGRAYKGAAWDQSPLHKQIYDEEFGTLGGLPFGAFVCDYYFDNSSSDVDVMSMLAKIGEDAHTPFIAAAAPAMLRLDSWSGMSSIRDLSRTFDTPDFLKWRSFREADESRYMALTLPRFLGRELYGPDGEPVETFHFVEDTHQGEHDKYLWVNAAYGMGVRIMESFIDYGWCTQIRGVTSGGTLQGLPTALFPTDDGGKDAKCPTEIAISDRREMELSGAGFLPLLHRKNTDQATFMGAQTAHKPAKYQDDDATASAVLSARLPYIFASARFAHYLKVMVRDWVGSKREEAQLQRDLKTWINQYVDGQPELSSEETKARKPLSAAEIEVVPDEANPGAYKAKFKLRPHYQFEKMNISLSMVSRLPNQRG